MSKECQVFKTKFLKLVKEYPSSLGYYLQDKIDEFEENNREPMKASHETVEDMINAIKQFGSKYPDFQILPADDHFSLLIGFVVYTIIDGKEIAMHVSVPIHAARGARTPLDLIMLDFKDHFQCKEVV